MVKELPRYPEVKQEIIYILQQEKQMLVHLVPEETMKVFLMKLEPEVAEVATTVEVPAEVHNQQVMVRELEVVLHLYQDMMVVMQ